MNRSDKILLTAFFISALNGYLALLFGVVYIIKYCLLQKNPEGLLKSFSLYILRVSGLNPVLFSSIPANTMKYAIMFLYAIGLIAISFSNEEYLRQTKTIFHLLLLYAVYVGFAALIKSCYPIVSIVKLILYVVAFYGVLKAVSATKETDWIGFYSNLYTVIMFLCLITIPFASLRTRNGFAFQGIFDHPNVFGIYGAAYISLILANTQKKNIYKTTCILLTLFMQYLSGSRTGLFSSLIIITVFFLSAYRNKMGKKLFYLLLVLLTISIIVLVAPSVNDYISSFIWKSKKGDLLYSRSGQIDRFLEKYESSPLIGTGFMSPFKMGVRSFALEFDLYVEEGNLFFAVIGQTGLFGLFFWLIIYLYILAKGNKELLHLFVAPFIISFGEMVFFSTNSIGTLLFIIFGIYFYSFDKYI